MQVVVERSEKTERERELMREREEETENMRDRETILPPRSKRNAKRKKTVLVDLEFVFGLCNHSSTQNQL